MPPDLGVGQVIPPLAAGQHHVAAGVAQVDVGLAALPLTPQAQAQAAAVTALLQGKGSVSTQHCRALPGHAGEPSHGRVKNVWMGHVGTWVSGEQGGGAGVTLPLDDLRALFPPQQFHSVL